ncbi:hypothetical protein C8Q80DRAFT_1178697 [Daedaleopsis nitida]|nr:hypothetical protein C8Q80DRAFT_1178697 [Daedaleopsis nitida]
MAVTLISGMDADAISDSPRSTATTLIRVISLSIAFYDYLLTLPAEWRFYSGQRSWRISPGCMLFIAIRYSSVAVLVLSNLGYFGDFFTPESCQRYYLAAPVFKAIQVTVSQLILGIRTINISRRSKPVIITVVVSYVLVTAAEWVMNLYNRVGVQSRLLNCTPGNKPPMLTSWLFYVFVIVYDLITLSISTAYLLRLNSNHGNVARLVKIMLTDGLVYFVALTATNILNLILYRSTDEATQNAGVSLGYTLTWIMTQRLLIHLRDAAAAHNRPITTQIVVSRPLTSALSVSRAMRQFASKDKADELTSAIDIDLDWSLSSHRESASLRTPSLLRADPTAKCASAAKATANAKSQSKGRAIASSRTDPASEEGSSGLTAHGRDAARAEDGKGDRDRDRDRVDARDGDGEEELELGVHVQVEEIVTVEYDPEAGARARGPYHAPRRVLWRDGGRGTGEGGRGGT